MTTQAIEKTAMYRAKDLQKVLGIGLGKAYTLMRSAPAFPSIKIGGEYFVLGEKLLHWLQLYSGREFMI